MPRTLYQIDAFTRVPFAGNPAGVVLDADGLTDTEMLAIARELNNSETAFVMRPRSADTDVLVRFFTPSVEVPTCGHATVAAHYARALEYGLGPGAVVQETGFGLRQVIEVVPADDGVRIVMRQGKANFEARVERRQVLRLLEALGAARDWLVEDAPVEVVSTGHSKVLLELADAACVDALEPDAAALACLSQAVGSNGFMVFARLPGGDGPLTYSRMFAPAIGIVEDPVTGNGHGPLGAYLARHGLVDVSSGWFTFRGRQGVAMGRPGHVDVTIMSKADASLEVSIAGDASVAFRGELAAV